MKTRTLSYYAGRYGLDAIVETGLDGGHGSGMGVPVARYVALDYQAANVELARAHGFDARHGDSGTLIREVLQELDGPALFWLDAHGIDCDNRVPVTVRNFPGWPKIPLLRELRAIAEWEYGQRSVVLVDDMPEMACWVGVGMGADPTPDAFDGFLDTLAMPWGRELRDGILRLTPEQP